MERAQFYKTLDDGTAKCQLCPHGCMIGNKEHGFCNTRINHNGNLYTETFGKITAISLDPIEKKPIPFLSGDQNPLHRLVRLHIEMQLLSKLPNISGAAREFYTVRKL
jgi:hypothetical protein